MILPPRVHRAPAGDLAAHGCVEALLAQPAHPAQVAIGGAGQGDGQRRVPGGGLERLPGGVQHRGPGALEQVPHLLHLRCLLGNQPGPAHPQMPQPPPQFIGWLGQVTAQLRRQPRDQHRVLVIFSD